MGLIENTMKNILVSDNYHNNLLVIYSRTFSTDTGNPVKNISLLDGLYDKESVDNYCCVGFENHLSYDK